MCVHESGILFLLKKLCVISAEGSFRISTWAWSEIYLALPCVMSNSFNLKTSKNRYLLCLL